MVVSRERWRWSRLVLIAGVGMCAAISACSSSGGANKTSGSTVSPHVTTSGGTSPGLSGASPSSPVSSSGPVAGSSAAGGGGQTRLTAITLQRGDLPASWQAAPHAANPADAANQAALVACVGGRNTAVDKTGNANSPSFSHAPAVISSSATSFRSQADVQADVAILHSPKISGCYEKLARRQVSSSLPPGATITSLIISITPGAHGLPANVVATGTGKIGVTSAGKSATVYLNVAFITGPRTEAEIDFTGVGQPVAAGMRNSLITKVAARAAQK